MAMMPSASSASAPYDPDSRIETDVMNEPIDPDDLDINDLDDPLSPVTAGPSRTDDRAPLNPAALTSAIPGEDRRAPTNTLDESVWSTLQRDILAVWAKMQAVLWPKFTFKKWPDADDVLEAGGNVSAFGSSAGSKVVGDWDLWGPLLFCLALSTLLSMAAGEDQKTDVFAGVFTIVWLGEAVITMQIKLLGGHISFFQSVSIIGYTLFPVVICALLAALKVWKLIRIPVGAVCLLWSLAAGVSILGGSDVVRNRVALAVFPMALFYFALVLLTVMS